MIKRITIFFIIVTSVIAFASCTSVKQIRYFNDLPDSTSIILPPLEQHQRVVEKGDRINITLTGESVEANQYFNNYGGGAQVGGAQATGAQGNGQAGGGYLVDFNGNIEFPKVGLLNVVGFTSLQLQDTLLKLFKPYLKNLIVQVRFSDIRFSVLGQVNGAGIKILQEQRVTLLDALAAAGDLPRSAKRYDIQVYRDYNGVRKIVKIDLRKKDILYNADLFQVRNNDVIIVQPRNIGFFTQEAGQIIGLLSLLTTTAFLIVTLIK